MSGRGGSSPQGGDIFQSVRGQSLSSRIVEQVIEALFAKKLQPGAFFGTEAQLAEMFETSRVPIREALGRLEALGLVNIKTGAGGGATIAEGAPDRFAMALAIQFMLVGITPEELFDARIAIECRAIELAASRITDDEVAHLRQLLARISEGEGGRAAVHRILALHHAIVEASKSRTLIALMQGLETALLSLYVRAWPTESSLPPRTYYHSLTEILDKLEARDGEAAWQAMRAHLLARCENVVSRLAARENEA